MTELDPVPGEVWKYGWLFVKIVSAGPKTVTYRVSAEGSTNRRIPKDRFLSKFRKTGL